MIVVDSSAMVSALVDREARGDWVRDVLRHGAIGAPAHMRFEAANVIRRMVVTDAITHADAHDAQRELASAPVLEWAFREVAGRVVELWPNVTAYDAAYVAMAEALDMPLLTLDERLSRAAGPQCAFLLPPS